MDEESDATDEGDMSAIGFMFDFASSKQTLTFSAAQIQISLRTIGEQPGHLQSGQYLWPAARFLAEHLVQNWSDLTADVVIELGAGCGACGLVASALSGVKSVLLTDYDPGSIRLLEENIVLNERIKTAGCVLLARSLTWGSVGEYLDEVLQLVGDRSRLVIGSDLIYCKNVIPPLLETVKSLLDDMAIFVLAFSFDIGEDSNAILLQTSSLLQLTITEIIPYSSDLDGGEGKRLLFISKASVYDQIFDKSRE